MVRVQKHRHKFKILHNKAFAADAKGRAAEKQRSVLRKIMRKSKRPTLREKLHSLNQSGSLARMLGAGISVGCGLPDWQELMQRVVKKSSLGSGQAKLLKI